MKRLRLRGDWSDTGPNARPEGETEAGGAGASVASDTQQLTAADFLRSPPAGEDREAEAGGPSTAAEQPPATSSTRSRNNDVPESSDEAGETNEQPGMQAASSIFFILSANRIYSNILLRILSSKNTSALFL